MVNAEPGLTPMVVGYFLKDDKVLLGLRKLTEWGLGKNLLSGIGGKVGDLPGLEDETLDEALEREVKEEVGVTVTSYHSVGEVTFLFPSKPKWNQRVHVYIVDGWEGEPMETDVIKPEWYDVECVPFDQMWDDSKYYVPLVLGGQAVKATFVYGSDNRTVIEKSVKTL